MSGTLLFSSSSPQLIYYSHGKFWAAFLEESQLRLSRVTHGSLLFPSVCRVALPMAVYCFLVFVEVEQNLTERRCRGIFNVCTSVAHGTTPGLHHPRD